MAWWGGFCVSSTTSALPTAGPAPPFPGLYPCSVSLLQHLLPSKANPSTDLMPLQLPPPNETSQAGGLCSPFPRLLALASRMAPNPSSRLLVPSFLGHSFGLAHLPVSTGMGCTAFA